MYARTTTLMADPSRIDAGISFVRDEVWPALRGMDGCAGMSLVVDRDSGRCIATASWESESALRESADRVMSFRERASEIMGSGAPEVQEWEVAVMHRSHATNPGACVRVAWSQIDPAKAEATLDFLRHDRLPRMEQLEGFASVSALIDRASGRMVSSIAFDSREALDRTREQTAQMRAQGTEQMGIEFLDVAEFELAFAHLHVPELV